MSFTLRKRKKLRRIIRIGVIGQSERPQEPLPQKLKEISYKVGYLIAKEGWLLVSGGRDGVMEHSSKGAKEAGGVTVGILPSQSIDEANEYVDVPITTGLGMGMRSELMVQTIDAVIMIGGKNGTLKELSAAYMNSKPIVIIRGTGEFADTIQNILYEGKYLDSRKNVEIRFADSPEEAISILKSILNIP
jgi:uncharacterized protein (TIGR00725 family)